MNGSPAAGARGLRDRNQAGWWPLGFSRVACSLCRIARWPLARMCSVMPDSLCPRVVRQAPPSMGFSRQEYWGGLPFSPPGDLPDPGMEPASISSFQNHILMAGGQGGEEAEEGRTPDSVEGFIACGLLT